MDNLKGRWLAEKGVWVGFGCKGCRFLLHSLQCTPKPDIFLLLSRLALLSCSRGSCYQSTFTVTSSHLTLRYLTKEHLMKEDTEEQKITGSDTEQPVLTCSQMLVSSLHGCFLSLGVCSSGKTAERCVGPVSGRTGWRVVPP